MEKKYEMTVSVTVDEASLSDLLAVADSDQCGCGWWSPADEADYEEAKRQLLAERKESGSDEKVCFEDVLARLLLNGKKLRLLDPESDWHWSGHKEGELMWKAQIELEGCVPEGGEWHEVGIEDILRGIWLYGESGVANSCGPTLGKILSDGDFWDADAVIQFAMYGEVIYG